MPWPLRATDIDPHGHLNNAIYWQAVEHALALGALDLARPLVAELDYREPIDAGDEIDLVTAVDDARGDRGFARVRRPQGRGAGGRSIASPQAAPLASL